MTARLLFLLSILGCALAAAAVAYAGRPVCPDSDGYFCRPAAKVERDWITETAYVRRITDDETGAVCYLVAPRHDLAPISISCVRACAMAVRP